MGAGWRSSWRVARQRSREGDLEVDINDCNGSSSSDSIGTEGCGCGNQRMMTRRAEAQEANPKGKAQLLCQTRRVDISKQSTQMNNFSNRCIVYHFRYIPSRPDSRCKSGVRYSAFNI